MSMSSLSCKNSCKSRKNNVKQHSTLTGEGKLLKHIELLISFDRQRSKRIQISFYDEGEAKMFYMINSKIKIQKKNELHMCNFTKIFIISFVLNTVNIVTHSW